CSTEQSKRERLRFQLSPISPLFTDEQSRRVEGCTEQKQKKEETTPLLVRVRGRRRAESATSLLRSISQVCSSRPFTRSSPPPTSSGEERRPLEVAATDRQQLSDLLAASLHPPLFLERKEEQCRRLFLPLPPSPISYPSLLHSFSDLAGQSRLCSSRHRSVRRRCPLRCLHLEEEEGDPSSVRARRTEQISLLRSRARGTEFSFPFLFQFQDPICPNLLFQQ
ncbi:unnamed protein product, partial [Musa acuminata var. zebrina]